MKSVITKHKKRTQPIDEIQVLPPSDSLSDIPILEDHPIAACWPLMNEAELNELTQSIKDIGQLYMIRTFEDMILDGRNRYRACLRAGVPPRIKPWNGDKPLEFALAANESRRTTTISQRSMIGGRMANLPHGTNQYGVETSGEASTSVRTIALAAKIMGVSKSSVERARRLLSKAGPSIIEKVDRGEISVAAALQELEPRSSAPASRKMVVHPPVNTVSRATSELGRQAERLLWSIPLGSGLSYAAYREIRTHLLQNFSNLSPTLARTVSMDELPQAKAVRLIATLKQIPEDQEDREALYQGMFTFICEVCPDLDDDLPDQGTG